MNLYKELETLRRKAKIEVLLQLKENLNGKCFVVEKPEHNESIKSVVIATFQEVINEIENLINKIGKEATI